MYRLASTVIGTLIFVRLAAAQGPARGAESTGSQGERVIRYQTDDGKQAVVRVSSLTMFTPTIDSDVHWEPTAAMFVYEYGVHNGKQSRQHIGRMEMTLNGSIQVESPSAWEHDAAKIGFAKWQAISDDGGRGVGIGPGMGKSGFRIRSRFMPGIALARVRGEGTAPYVPLTAPRAVLDEVARFAQQDVLHVPVIAPIIPPEEIGEPESKAALIAYLRYHFGQWLTVAHHPNAAAILKELDDALSAATEARQSDMNSALEELQSQASIPGTSQMIQDVSKALTLCITHVLRRPPQ